MIRPLICLAVVAAALLLPATPARAAQSYDNCTGFISSLPATISTQGTWCLDKDLSTTVTSGNAITITANNVTLDCNHFKVGGLAAGAGTTAYGVRAASRFNTTVRNCNVRGFYIAIYLSSGGGHLIEDSSFDSNTAYGLYVTSAGSTIRSNLIVDTGGSTANSLQAHGIYGAYGVDILNNTVSGVAPIGINAAALGIFTTINGDGSINGNRVRGLAPTGSGIPWGIYASGSPGSVIRDNDVTGPGISVAEGVGVYCGSNTVTATGNVVSRFATGITGCLASGNIVNTN